MPDSQLTAAVLIATYNRPDHLQTCLDHLDQQTVAPDAIVIVDSSPDDRSAEVAQRHGGITYLRNPLGRGHTATSRRMGLEAAGDVDIIVFIDDDAFARPNWLEELLRRYDDPSVAGVGGRADNGQPGEESVGLDAIGQFLPDGTLTGNFAADPGADVRVDHLLGANMSLRVAAVRAVGGIEDHYPGTCLREESEIALRLRLAGYRIVYTPAALVRHVGGTYAKGRRFDARYTYYGQRNHIVLLARVLGPRDPRFHRYLRVAVGKVGGDVGYAARALRRGRLRGEESVISGVGRGLINAASTTGGIATGLSLVLTGRVPQARTAPRVPTPSITRA
ncbi:glycosyltransferase family 2 protein [Gryllotalpicola reticulitermitis]|uniref:Glycosyltransferase family 2 protein n=1 Tax=Gryllotalpicola reticulitermitis TaxID=1184153 RepID=A0ABV8Q5M2_9MICO